MKHATVFLNENYDYGQNLLVNEILKIKLKVKNDYNNEKRLRTFNLIKTWCIYKSLWCEYSHTYKTMMCLNMVQFIWVGNVKMNY